MPPTVTITPHAAHEVGDLCWMLVEGEVAGSRHPLGKLGGAPCGRGPESPSGARGAGMFHFSPGAVSQAFFPALSFSPSVCLNSLLHRVRGLWSSLDRTN